MGMRYRIRQAAAEARLRPIRVGRWAEVRGRPLIDVTDAVAGDAFRLHSVEATTVIRGSGRLRFGDDVFLNSGVRIECRHAITFGDHVLIGWGVDIFDSDMHGLEGKPPMSGPIVVGSGSWVGARVMILPGVTIGRRSVVAAGSVVTRDVPADTLVAGNPARVVRALDHAPDQERAFG